MLKPISIAVGQALTSLIVLSPQAPKLVAAIAFLLGVLYGYFWAKTLVTN